jgi:DNA/RNA-binding domain of Phe-tRNA-synthetase-like protein
MVNICIDEQLKMVCPGLRLGCIEAGVTVKESSEELSSEINSCIIQISKTLQTDQISKIPAIASSRKAYSACGKDPARYRLSAEALLRRVVSGKGLYSINNVVDQLNLVSISTGFSIGGYDANQISGNVVFGIGNTAEPYVGIGRGELNIENLPVFRDSIGAFGSPTSDSVRTGVTQKTSQFLMVIIDFCGDKSLNVAVEEAVGFLENYCDATNINEFIIE